MFKNLLRFTSILLIIMGNAYAETFSEYNVTGNQRVSSQTIINFSKLKKDVDLTKDDLNEAIKNLYESNFFEKVSVSIINNTLNIDVEEYPII